MKTNCPTCGREFKRVGSHWAQSTCEYPELTEHQKEVTTGLLMGDGTVCREKNKNPRIKVEVIKKKYLEYINKIFGILGTGVSLCMTAEESAKKAHSRGFDPNANAENYSDKYIWRSRRTPKLEEFSEWYSTGQKVWPENITLTPTVLKHWYCGDGTFDNKNSHHSIHIGMDNEIENKNKVSRFFNKAGLPSPTYSGHTIYFTKNESEKLWKYMGEPLPGFEYKWPEEYRNA